MIRLLNTPDAYTKEIVRNDVHVGYLHHAPDERHEVNFEQCMLSVNDVCMLLSQYNALKEEHNA